MAFLPVLGESRVNNLVRALFTHLYDLVMRDDSLFNHVIIIIRFLSRICVNWLLLLDPFYQTTIQDTNIFMSHCMEHPCSPEPKEITWTCIIAYNFVSHFDIQLFHFENKMITRGQHKWQLCFLIAETIKVKIHRTLNSTSSKIHRRAITCRPS